MNALSTGFALLLKHFRAYLALTAIFYSLVACGMLYAAFDRSIQDRIGSGARDQFASALPWVTSAYRNGHITSAAAVTFIINLVGGCIATIAIPSLIIPFSGLFLGGCRAIMWGLIFSPSGW